MKRIILLFAMTIVAAWACAQSTTKNPQIDEVDALCRQVDSLAQRITDKYATYTNDTVYYNLLYKTDWLGKSAQDNTFKELESELKTLRTRIKTADDSIQFINQEIAWVDTLSRYYASHTLDELFVAIDLQMLETHQKLLGVLDKPVPHVVNDLHVLLECAELLNKEYDEKVNYEYLGLLKKVPDCDKKKELKWLLETHSAVTSETNAWIGEGKSSLYDLMEFRKYLKDYYGVKLEKHYPFLADKARKTIKLPDKQ